MKNKIFILFALILFGCSSIEKGETSLEPQKKGTVLSFQGLEELSPYDSSGYDKLGYDKNGYDKDGYDKSGYNKLGYDRNGYNFSGSNKAGNNIIVRNFEKQVKKAKNVGATELTGIMNSIESATNKMRDIKPKQNETQEKFEFRKKAIFRKFMEKYKGVYLYEIPEKNFVYNLKNNKLILNMNEINLGRKKYTKKYEGMSSWGTKTNISSVLLESKKVKFLNKSPIEIKLPSKEKKEDLNVRILFKLLNDEGVFEKTTSLRQEKPGSKVEYYDESNVLKGILCYVEVIKDGDIIHKQSAIKKINVYDNRIIDFKGDSKKYKHFFNKIGDRLDRFNKNLVFIKQNELSKKSNEKKEYIGLFDLESEKIVLEPKFNLIRPYNNRYAYVEYEDRFNREKLFGLFDLTDKKLALDPAYTGIRTFDDRYLYIEEITKSSGLKYLGLFDTLESKVALEPAYKSFRRVGSDYIVVRKMIVPGEYSEGVFRISENRIIIEPIYEEVLYGKSRKEDYFKCKKKGKDVKIFVK